MFWIRADDKLPGNREEVLAVTDNDEFVVAAYIDGAWELNEKAMEGVSEYTRFAIIKGAITHWQPLPLLPNQQMHKQHMKQKRIGTSLRSFLHPQ
jgi:hypothetical protein